MFTIEASNGSWPLNPASSKTGLEYWTTFSIRGSSATGFAYICEHIYTAELLKEHENQAGYECSAVARHAPQLEEDIASSEVSS